MKINEDPMEVFGKTHGAENASPDGVAAVLLAKAITQHANNVDEFRIMLKEKLDKLISAMGD